MTSEAVSPTATGVFAHVVCAVDGSPEGLEAVRQVWRLADAGAKFTLVSVSETHLAARTGPMAVSWAEQLQRDAQTALDDAKGIVDDAEALRLHGRAADTVLQAVGDLDATLVAVGSHEFSRGAGILIGSVATRLVHEAPCSVFIARSPSRDVQPPLSIVVGLDGSATSLAAAALADALAKRLRASVRFVVARGAGPEDLAHAPLESCGFELTFTDAKPVPALLDAARDADLLLVGSRGLTGVRALGSVSERVAHRAPCSLIVVR